MYKVIVNGTVEYYTEDRYLYTSYLIERGLIYNLVSEFLPFEYEMELATAEAPSYEDELEYPNAPVEDDCLD